MPAWWGIMLTIKSDRMPSFRDH
uniref:Uncharacterized protein n=1 Tax=Anguilla anguilla TaxID=7936 RepID=A0A0E9VEP0_ANGAN